MIDETLILKEIDEWTDILNRNMFARKRTCDIPESEKPNKRKMHP